MKQGDFGQQTDYAVDPVDQARSYARAGASVMHLVDLDGAKAGRVVQLELIGKIVAGAGIPVQVGGGVRSTADVEALLGVGGGGAARVVVGTAALEDWAWFKGLAESREFAGKLVLAIDAKDGVVATRGWTASSGKLAVEVAREVKGWKLGGLLYTDVAVDGMLSGPNVAKTRELVEATDVPVIASGGVGKLSDIEELKGTGAEGVIVGRAIYEGKVRLEDALEVAGR